MTYRHGLILVTLTMAAMAAGCEAGGDAAGGAGEGSARQEGTAGNGVATALASGPAELSSEQIEAGRLDPSWRRYAEQDAVDRRAAETSTSPGSSPDPTTSATTPAATSATSGSAADTTTGAATGGSSDTTQVTWNDISPQAVNAQPRRLPIQGDVQGPAVAKIQILLDQVGFSPGIIDGRWGKNTEKAVYWFQEANGLSATGAVDERTLAGLAQRARSRQVEQRQLTEADVAGPFEDLPEDVYARADQPCLCYESLREQLGEVFHADPALLEQLNPGVDLNAVQAGQSLWVPAVDAFHTGEMPEGKYTGGEEVARVVISDGGHYVHALDEGGNILYHFPSTLGSDYAPSPSGQFSVESITFDPTWHYQPDLLTGVDPSREDAILPAGPNNAVGVVWMQLSKPHYGVHGTSAPETIGYVTSHGCVRLTNWDAAFLGQRIPPGVTVEFRDVTNGGG